MPSAAGPISLAPDTAEAADEAPTERTSPSAPARRMAERAWPILPVVWYTAVALYGLGPLLPHLATQLNSDTIDGVSSMWSFIEFPARLVHLQNPFYSPRAFYPVGADLSFDTTVPAVGVIVSLLRPFVGLALAVNISTVLGGALSGLAAHLIARHEGANRAAAYVAGTAFIMLPARYERMGYHFNLFHTEFLAFGLLALVKLRDKPTPLRAIAFGSLLGLTYVNDVTYGVILVILVPLLLLPRSCWKKIGLRSYGIVAVASAVVAGPLLAAQVASILRDGGGRTVGDSGVERYSSDLLSWVVPPSWHPLWGFPLDTRFGPINGGEPLAFVGLTLAVLSLVAVWRRFPSRSAWIASVVTFGVLSLGPFLKVGGRTGSGFVSAQGVRYRIPLPFLALQELPIANGLRAPGRFSIPAGLALAVLAALGVSRLSGGRHRLLRFLPVLAVAAVLVEFPARPTAPTLSTRVPAPYAVIARDPAKGAVLELPILWGDGTRGIGSDRSGTSPEIFRYWNRVAHDKPVVNGHVARLPDKRAERLTSYATYRTILALEGMDGFKDEGALDRQALQGLGISYVVYHRDHPIPPLLERVEQLRLEVLTDDTTIVVWKVPVPDK